MPEQVTPQQLLHNKATFSGWAHVPQHAGDGLRLFAALLKRVEPPALHTRLAKCPAQLACSYQASGEGQLGHVQRAPASTRAQPVPVTADA